jgi:hypothetical protein
LSGTDEYKQSLGPERKRRPPNLSYGRQDLKKDKPKQKKKTLFEIWIEEYKELLAFKKIELSVYDYTQMSGKK